MPEIAEMQQRNFCQRGDRARLADLEHTINVRLQGVYFNFLVQDWGYEQIDDDVVDLLIFTYGGGVAALASFLGRVIRQHMNPKFRAEHPSAHYKIVDTPGYTANYLAALVFKIHVHEYDVWAAEGIMCNAHRFWTTDSMQIMMTGLFFPDWPLQSRLNRQDPLLTTARLRSSLDDERRLALQDQTYLDSWLIEQESAPIHSAGSFALSKRRAQDDQDHALLLSHLPPLSDLPVRPLSGEADGLLYEPEDDDLIILLRETYKLTFKQIQKHLPGRLWERLRSRYTTKLSPNAKLKLQQKESREAVALNAQRDAMSTVLCRPAVVKNAKYSADDDSLLRYLRETANVGYDIIVGYFPGRSVDSLQNRFKKYLCEIAPAQKSIPLLVSEVKPRPTAHSQLRFSPEDDRLLIHLIEERGCQRWQELMDIFPGRANESTLKRYNTFLRVGTDRDLAMSTDMALHFYGIGETVNPNHSPVNSEHHNGPHIGIPDLNNASSLYMNCMPPHSRVSSTIPAASHSPPDSSIIRSASPFQDLNHTGRAQSSVLSSLTSKPYSTSSADAHASDNIAARPFAGKRAHFTPGDDKLILHLLDDLRWSYKDMLVKFPGRDQPALQNRYSGHLSKGQANKHDERVEACHNIRARPFAKPRLPYQAMDDRLIIYLKEHIQVEAYSECTKFLPGRSENSVRNRYQHHLNSKDGKFRSAALQIDMSSLLQAVVEPNPADVRSQTDNNALTDDTEHHEDTGQDMISPIVGSKRCRADAFERGGLL